LTNRPTTALYDLSRRSAICRILRRTRRARLPKGPDNLVLQLLREMRADMGGMKADMQEMKATMATKAVLAAVRAELQSDMRSLRADVASDLLTTRKEIGEQIVGLRRAVVEYHSAVIGHGILISELEARVRRLEQNAGLAPIDAL
jgi:hypothetical protein